MSSHYRHYGAGFRTFLIVWLFFSGSTLKAQEDVQVHNQKRYERVPVIGPFPGFGHGESLDSLKQRYNELEQQTHQLANKLKQSKSPTETEIKELQTAVRKSFEARQALQRAELNSLAQRMKSMQQSIDMRDKLADKVVQRRVEDLLNPNLTWGTTPSQEPKSQVTDEPQKSISTSPSLSSVQAAVDRLLMGRLPTPAIPPGGTLPIAFLGIDYQGPWNLGDFKDELQKEIEAQISQSSKWSLVSRRMTERAIAETRIKSTYMLSWLVWERFQQSLRSMDIEFHGLMIARLKHLGDTDSTRNGEYEVSLELQDGHRNVVEHFTLKGKANGPLKETESNSLRQFASPQELLAAVDEYGKSGSHEKFIKLFNDEGVRDLAGSMLMQAVMQTSIDELSRQLTFGGVAEVEPDFVAFRKVLQRWLPQSVTTAQQEAMGKGLSTIMSSTGGGSPDHAALNEFVISLRESVAGIGDHRKFSIEIMQAFERRTKRKFVYFGNADHENEWQISPFGDRAIATLIDGSPGMATTITLQQANGTWRISSLFNELLIETQPAAPSPTSTTKPKYSGQPISWWLDSYWDNAIAIPKTAENSAQEFVASEAIRKLREKPECEAAIEAALAKWFASVEHEVNEGQLTRAAKCIVTVAGPTHQETAVNLLFKIWKRMPLLNYAEQGEMADDATELNQLLSQLVLNDQLAAQFAERLTHGDSSNRSLVLYGLLSLMGRFGVETDNDRSQLESWLSQHAERLAPAIESASHDENEKIRMTSLIQLATLIHFTKLNPESSRLPTILLNAISDASPHIRSTAILLLTSKELAPTVKSQNVPIIPTLNQIIESDAVIDVRYSALDGLMQLDATSELVHKTLMEWAKSDEHEKVKYALDLTLRNYRAGDRPKSIDELIELLSGPEWGTKVEVNYNNWSTHHRWARQYAIAILGEYSTHAHRAIPTLEAELARNNKDTLSFATKALDRVRGYCPDLPIDKLQGQWEFVSIQKPEGSTSFFDLQTASDQQPFSVITVSGTQLKLGDRMLGEISHHRGSNTRSFAMLLDPEGKKRHCNGRIDFDSEYEINGALEPEWLKLEVCELLRDWDATQTTKQVYEFRPVKK